MRAHKMSKRKSVDIEIELSDVEGSRTLGITVQFYMPRPGVLRPPVWRIRLSSGVFSGDL